MAIRTIIASATNFCPACGGKIIAGITTVKLDTTSTTQNDLSRSSRHEECWGKPNKYSRFSGLALMESSDSGIEDIVKTKPKPGLSQILQAKPVESKTADTPPWEPQPHQGEDVDLAKAIAGMVSKKLETAVTEPKVREIVESERSSFIGDALTAFEQSGVNEDRIRRQVQEYLDLLGKVKVELHYPDGSSVTMSGLQHAITPKVARKMALRMNVYLYGPAGSGKSTIARKIAEAMGLPYYYVSLNPLASPTRIEGYQTPHGEYVMTVFRKAYEFGGVYCADEMDNASPNLLVSINNAIDSQLGSFPDGMVVRHKDFIFVGTGNTNLSGDAVYRDRKALDKATISRFAFQRVDYDQKLERNIAIDINPKSVAWINWIHAVRDFAKTNNPALFAYCTPRATYDGAKLLAIGEPVAEVADDVLFKGSFDATAMTAVLTKCPLPVAVDMKLSKAKAA